MQGLSHVRFRKAAPGVGGNSVGAGSGAGSSLAAGLLPGRRATDIAGVGDRDTLAGDPTGALRYFPHFSRPSGAEIVIIM